MSDSGFFLLPTNKLYKRENTKRLKNFPVGYVGSFYRNWQIMSTILLVLISTQE